MVFKINLYGLFSVIEILIHVWTMSLIVYGEYINGGPWATRIGFQIFEIQVQNACPNMQ